MNLLNKEPSIEVVFHPEGRPFYHCPVYLVWVFEDVQTHVASERRLRIVSAKGYFADSLLKKISNI